MRCESCKHYWHYPADYTSPYGEWACMKLEMDLWGAKDEEVEDCEEYESQRIEKRECNDE